MIRTFYGLSEPPFGKQIPADELLPTAAFTELTHRLDYLRQRRGLMLVTGEPGTGKTATVRAFVETLNPAAHKLFYVPLSTVTPLDFYTQLNRELGGDASVRKSTLFKNLQSAIQDYVTNAKKTPVLILDEAHYLPDKTLHELPILLNFRMDSLDPLLTLLVAHPHFAARLHRPTFRNIDQRILLRYDMPPLSEAETKTYIHHHLARAGARSEIFTDAAHLAVHKSSGGLCREINRLALAALTLGALEKKHTLDEEDIYRATAEI